MHVCLYMCMYMEFHILQTSALFWEIAVEVFLATSEAEEILHCKSIYMGYAFPKIEKKSENPFYNHSLRLIVKFQDNSVCLWLIYLTCD